VDPDLFPGVGGTPRLLLIEPDAPEEIGEPRVAAERIEPGPQEHARIEALRLAAFEPHHCLIPIAERGVDNGYFRGIGVRGARALSQVFEQNRGITSSPRRDIRSSEVRDARGGAA
jgi:hypothetical protein